MGKGIPLKGIVKQALKIIPLNFFNLFRKMVRIIFSNGCFKRLENRYKEIENLRIVPSLIENYVDSIPSNELLQIMSIVYCDFYGVLWIELFDGICKQNCILENIFWSNTKSYRDHMAAMNTPSLETKNESLNIEKGDVLVIKNFTFESLILCQEPFYKESILKVKNYSVIKTDRKIIHV